MKVRKPIDKEKTIDTNRNSKKYLSEVLPSLEKYKTGMNNYHLNKWMKTAQVYVRAFLAEGMSPEEIRDRLGCSEAQYDKLEQMVMEKSGARFISMGTAHRYYVYMLRMDQCLRELDEFIRIHMIDDPKQSGVVGAIKAKANILNDTMKMGQELGIIAKRAKELRVLGELNLAVMPTEELVQLYEDKLTHFQAVVENSNNLPPAYQRILKNAIDVHAEEKDKESYCEIETAGSAS